MFAALTTVLLAATPVVPSPSPLYELHSGFWMNLHHALYGQAQRKLQAGGAKLWLPPEYEILPAPASLTEGERAAWADAVATYASRWATKDLLRDDELGHANEILEQRESDAALRAAELPEGMAAALNKVAPLYRRKGWPEQDAANRAWVDAHAELFRRWGPTLKKETAQAFAAEWPAKPIRVDLVGYCNGGGAYTTTGDAVHTTFSTRDPRHAGIPGLEVFFHETSHALIEVTLQPAITKAAAARHIAEPPQLWHAVQFYVLGELFRRHFPDYTPYPAAQGLWTRAWPRYLAPLEKDVKPYLEGKTTLDAALVALVDDTAHVPGD